MKINTITNLGRRLKRKFFHILKKIGWEPFSSASPETIIALERAFDLTKDLGGGYYEFGLYKGYSFYKAHQFAKKYNHEQVFFGFDSFEGLPIIKENSPDFGWKFLPGQYKGSIDEVKKT